jgi:hypothetical protein
MYVQSSTERKNKHPLIILLYPLTDDDKIPKNHMYRNQPTYLAKSLQSKSHILDNIPGFLYVHVHRTYSVLCICFL